MSDREESPEPRQRRTAEEKEQLVQQRADDKKKAEKAGQAAKQAIKKRFKKSSISDYSYHIVFGGFVAVCFIALATTFMGDNRKLSVIPVIEEDEIHAHNQQELSYTLGKNEFFQDWSLSDAKAIVNNQLSNKPTLPRCMTLEDTTIIPERYNFRESYAECIRPIANQGNCSSSYTFTAASALSDRFCQQTKGKMHPHLSAQTPLSCDAARNYGCKGGAVSTVFDYARREGLVEEECLPYAADSEVACPTNLDQCQKYFVSEYCVTGGEEGIKREVYKNGPVIAVIPIYRDFLVYKDGVYQVQEGTSKFHGGHALKVVGWDKDDEGTGFWIVENTWGDSWGIKGLGHIAVGQKQLYLDEFVIAPHPKLEKEGSAEVADDEDLADDLVDEKAEPVDLDDKSSQ